MPCIQIKTNVQVSDDIAQTVKSQLGRIITYLPERISAACGSVGTVRSPLPLWR